MRLRLRLVQALALLSVSAVLLAVLAMSGAVVPVRAEQKQSFVLRTGPEVA